MFNPDIQYRCTIIRGKAQKELDNLLPAYAKIIAEICPCSKSDFHTVFNDEISNVIYGKDFEELDEKNRKTIRNHITEIAGKLFGLYYFDTDFVYESESNKKLLDDNDQPAFFKNVCLNFQFPNGTQKINTVLERIADDIKFKPFHFVLALMDIAAKQGLALTKDEIAYYVLNAKQVLQGLISINEVLEVIKRDRQSNNSKILESSSFNTQHIREQLNLLELANLIFIDDEYLVLNHSESILISIFIDELNLPLKFNIYKYDLDKVDEKALMYSEWSEYYGKIALKDHRNLSTTVEALQRVKVVTPTRVSVGVDHTILGNEGEEYVFELEKNRVLSTHPRLVNKVLLLGDQRGLGYDISSVEANENLEDPEFARFIEVKSTKRITEPNLEDATWTDTVNLTRKEWVAAKQYKTAYNIYRVYFTPSATIVRKINNPFEKNETGIIAVLPTVYRMDFDFRCIDIQY